MVVASCHAAPVRNCTPRNVEVRRWSLELGVWSLELGPHGDPASHRSAPLPDTRPTRWTCSAALSPLNAPPPRSRYGGRGSRRSVSPQSRQSTSTATGILLLGWRPPPSHTNPSETQSPTASRTSRVTRRTDATPFLPFLSLALVSGPLPTRQSLRSCMHSAPAPLSFPCCVTSTSFHSYGYECSGRSPPPEIPLPPLPPPQSRQHPARSGPRYLAAAHRAPLYLGRDIRPPHLG